MLPFPIYYRSVNCTTDGSEQLSIVEFNGFDLSTLDDFMNGTTTGWPDCPILRNQAYTFLVFSAAILCLSVASLFVEKNRKTEPAVASMISSMLATETVIAICLIVDSLLFLCLGLCRRFPVVKLAPMLSLTIGINQWLASVCLFYRNWLVALISLTRYRLFSRHSGGGGGGGGGRCRGSVLSHRARAERSSLRQFRLASCLLLGNAGLFCTFLSLKTVGELCDSQSWLSAPVTVDRFLLAVNNASLFLAVNTGVVFPLQLSCPSSSAWFPQAPC
ncbi:hypothetical protein BOX15_Mlig022859g3 [Macrostomum lignano]|uniref:Uncharacterized protein n=1 Tax=Macrostomum lignano TaxID=282301 RepID=A0A267FSX2_9PLAT|nr:hypothetical protein BOX15_Mlig022859g3 [Macrostomum lignano]